MKRPSPRHEQKKARKRRAWWAKYSRAVRELKERDELIRTGKFPEARGGR